MQPKVYVAGPMRGYVDFNFPAFDLASSLLRLRGFEVFSPADHDREIGFDGQAQAATHPTDAFIQEVIMWDLARVAESDAIYMLVGWQMSSGARLEHDLARFLKKVVLFEETESQYEKAQYIERHLLRIREEKSRQEESEQSLDGDPEQTYEKALHSLLVSMRN